MASVHETMQSHVSDSNYLAELKLFRNIVTPVKPTKKRPLPYKFCISESFSGLEISAFF